MIFRKSVQNDSQPIFKIIQELKQWSKQHGIIQWHLGYPTIQVISDDIAKGNSYVLEIESKIVAAIALIFGIESYYEKIYQGNWLTNQQQYLTIHRMAVDKQWMRKGLGTHMIKQAQKICRQHKISSIRLDTTESNNVMKNFLKKNGYTYCGIVYPLPILRTAAFQKIIL